MSSFNTTRNPCPVLIQKFNPTANHQDIFTVCSNFLSGFRQELSASVNTLQCLCHLVSLSDLSSHLPCPHYCQIRCQAANYQKFFHSLSKQQPGFSYCRCCVDKADKLSNVHHLSIISKYLGPPHLFPVPPAFSFSHVSPAFCLQCHISYSVKPAAFFKMNTKATL